MGESGKSNAFVETFQQNVSEDNLTERFSETQRRPNGSSLQIFLEEIP